jgi:hypothetical protein
MVVKKRMRVRHFGVEEAGGDAAHDSLAGRRGDGERESQRTGGRRENATRVKKKKGMLSTRV